MTQFEKNTIQKWFYDREIKSSLQTEEEIETKIKNMAFHELINIYYRHYDNLIQRAQDRLEKLYEDKDRFNP